MLDYIFYIIIGIVSGIASGVFGIGGGMIIVPLALAFAHLSAHQAIALSVIQMIFASIFGSYLNYKNKILNLKDGIFVGIGGLIGASFSGIIIKLLEDIYLTSIFLFISIISFIKYAFGVKNVIVQNQRSILVKNFILICAGAITGVFAISLGIGGGLLIAPILGYFLGYDSKKVVSISLFFVIFSSFSGTISFILQDIINKEIIFKGCLVGIGSSIGVFLGIKIIQKMKLNSHRKALLSIYALSIVLTIFALIKKINNL